MVELVEQNKIDDYQINENSYYLPLKYWTASTTYKINVYKDGNTTKVDFDLHRLFNKSSAIIYSAENIAYDNNFDVNPKKIEQLDSNWYYIEY